MVLGSFHHLTGCFLSPAWVHLEKLGSGNVTVCVYQWNTVTDDEIEWKRQPQDRCFGHLPQQHRVSVGEVISNYFDLIGLQKFRIDASNSGSPVCLCISLWLNDTLFYIYLFTLNNWNPTAAFKQFLSSSRCPSGTWRRAWAPLKTHVINSILQPIEQGDGWWIAWS